MTRRSRLRFPRFQGAARAPAALSAALLLAALLLAALLLLPAVSVAGTSPDPTLPATPGQDEPVQEETGDETAEEPPAAELAPGELASPEPEGGPTAGVIPKDGAGDPAGDGDQAAEADPVADFYLSRCAGCHTVGGGYLTAPDLLPSTGWPASDLALAVERMEKNVGPLSEEQVEQLVAFLRSENLQQRIAAARERQVQEMAATLEPASASKGRALYHGDLSFENRGVPCSACHRAGPPDRPKRGGTLATDLSDAYARLGEPALMSAAENPGFPLMKAAYRDHPVTRQEAVHLVAYLEEISPEESRTGTAPAGAAAPGGPAAGASAVARWGTVLAGAVLLTLAVPLLSSRGRRRLRGRGVRRALVERARSG